MAIFNSYVKLPEGNCNHVKNHHFQELEPGEEFHACWSHREGHRPLCRPQEGKDQLWGDMMRNILNYIELYEDMRNMIRWKPHSRP